MISPLARASRPLLAPLLAAALASCGQGPRIEARQQVVVFGPAPAPEVNQSTATVSASASSGLPVRYSSRTPLVCEVDPATGLVTAAVTGTCTIAAGQQGDSTWAAAWAVTQDVSFRFAGVITFGPAPSLAVHDLATVRAVESTGLAVGYAAATPGTCSVEPATGLVSALAAGECTIVASAGEATASQAIAIAPAGSPEVPDAPSAVEAALVGSGSAVRVRVGAVRAGGLPITAYAVASDPPGLSATGAVSPVEVTCPGSCSGYRFTLAALNDLGTGPPSGPANVVTTYEVVATFREPDTQPNDTIFVGSYSLDSSAGVVSGLRGRLSEAMTGGPAPYPDDSMTWLDLGHQLSSLPVVLDGQDGWLVTAFHLETTGTLTDDPRFGGTDGWTPGTGSGLHFGFPGPNPGNAYVRIFVRASDPASPLAPGQLDWIAYADCAPGGMMGATCMTGTSVAAYGTAGTMGGTPASQVTTRR